MHRISLPSSTDNELRQRAHALGMSSDDVIVSYILAGIERSRLSRVSAALKYFGACVVTAALVLIGLRILSISIQELSSPIQIPVARTLHWSREFVFSFAPWPITILIALWLIARSGSAFWLLLGLFGSLRKIKLFGAELELNEQTKRKIQSAATEIDVAIDGYKKRIDKEVARLASRHQIDHKLSQLIDTNEMKHLVPTRDEFRCTIHIPDPIEHGRLYQLLDYYPSGAGRGRSFSTRYGIIGKVWRTDDPLLEPDLLGHATAPEETHSVITMIMRDWGMNRREAEQAIKHRSYFCFLLLHEQTKVGLVFMDSTRANAFNVIHQTDVIEIANKELSPGISRLLDDLSAVSLEIDLEQD
jgi:hypothetical protein